MTKLEAPEKSFAGEGMYREHILDHYQHPRNFGEWKTCSVQHTELNPVCGDQLSFQLNVDEKGKVMDVHFNGQGCAISIASASLLSDEIKGKTMVQIQKLDKNGIQALLGITLGPARLKCAMLSLDIVKNACLIYQKYGKGGK
jgi:nitrogen fixation NifU-like protein